MVVVAEEYLGRPLEYKQLQDVKPPAFIKANQVEAGTAQSRKVGSPRAAKCNRFIDRPS